ncbi:DUF6496 domain-containing protein [Mesorhizobium captivum]|uniref:DUF6496 domain-containing protein n=1 Tax=Mesorhizobium captivum TaxID=3072319 RepID=UPI002A24A1A3|nr:DUF6496 domain-containing protein [Mesorhizobium sp. VK22E]MDX8504027.1 DUF6496 domain-containing protein [Mesorhizobium sp. VK22E]
MPDKKTIEKARQDKREGKSPSTQAGEFVREEIDEIRRGKHGARSTKQAIAIGLSEARRAGVDLPPPKKGKVKESTRKSAEYAHEVGQGERKPKRRPKVSKAVSEVLQDEPKAAHLMRRCRGKPKERLRDGLPVSDRPLLKKLPRRKAQPGARRPHGKLWRPRALRAGSKRPRRQPEPARAAASSRPSRYAFTDDPVGGAWRHRTKRDASAEQVAETSVILSIEWCSAQSVAISGFGETSDGRCRSTRLERREPFRTPE